MDFTNFNSFCIILYFLLITLCRDAYINFLLSKLEYSYDKYNNSIIHASKMFVHINEISRPSDENPYFFYSSIIIMLLYLLHLSLSGGTCQNISEFTCLVSDVTIRERELDRNLEQLRSLRWDLLV